MNDVFIKIIIGIGTIIISSIAERLFELISAKIKNEKVQKHLSIATEIVCSAVKSTYQEFVQTLKEDDLFDLDAQQEALSIARGKIREELTDKSRKYIEDTFGSVDAWIDTTIHSVLYDLKN